MKTKDTSRGLTVERVRHLLAYDPVDGVLRWKPVDDLNPRVFPGQIAGSTNGRGYVHVSVDGHLYFVHRLIWFHVFGEWPKDQIDHKDLDKTNNRLDNLREANNSQNNTNVVCTNVLGIKGVSKIGKRWKASIGKDGRTHYLGVFNTPEAAHAAYMEAAVRLHGEFANDGRVH